MRLFLIFQLCLVCLTAGISMRVAAEVVVIVSPRSAVTALSANQVSDIFLGKSGSFPDGSVALPVDMPERAVARRDFYEKLTGKSMQWLKAYWSKLIFTGRGEPPRELPDSAAVKRLVADNPHYVGYIDKNAVDGSVKVVMVLH
jgi:hypothetical protein